MSNNKIKENILNENSGDENSKNNVINLKVHEIAQTKLDSVNDKKIKDLPHKDKDVSNEQIIAKFDSSYKQFLDEKRRTTNKRDRLFNDFLNAYTISFKKKSEQKISLKSCFFVLIIIIFFIIVLTPIIVIILFVNNKDNVAQFAISIIGSFIELFTAFLVLPRIIAEYLFNKEEDSNMVNIIEKMQTYNLEQIKEVSQNQNNKK